MAFPATSVLDALTGAGWDSTNNTLDPTGGGRDTNPTPYSGTGIGTTSPGFAWDFWRNTATYGPDAECFIEIPTAGAGNITRVYARLQQPNTTLVTADAYIVQATPGSTAGAYRLDNSVIGATLGTWTASASATGFGIRVTGTGATVTVECYEKISGTWTLVHTYTDTSGSRITSAGYIGALGLDTAGASRWSNFGGGAYTQTISVGTASETDTAGTAGALTDQTISVGTATETDSAPTADVIFGGAGFLLDTFTDTDSVVITSHTGETPVSWTAHPLWEASHLITYANRIVRTNLANQLALASVTPPGADYVVSCVLRGIDGPSSTGVAKGVVARASATTDNFYWADYVDAATPQVRLFKCVAGAFTSLGTYNVSLPAGENMVLSLSCVGSSIKVLVNGVERISAVDSAHTTAGKIGVTCSSGLPADTGNTGFHLSAVNAYVPDVSQTISVGTASETDTAGIASVVAAQTISVGTAQETNTAGVATVRTVSGTRAQGGMVLLFRPRTSAPSQTVTVGTASETDSALPITIPADQTVTVGTAVETDSAPAVVIPLPQTISVGTATETDTAGAATEVRPGTVVIHPQGMVPGTVIGAYLRWEWRGPVAAKLNAGPGAVVQETTVSDDLTATFILAVGEYVAYAEDYPTRRLFFMVTDSD